jgi:hypothetical protein
VETAGVETVGVKTAGVETVGVKTAGVETVGVKTAGVETVGVKTAGVETVVVLNIAYHNLDSLYHSYRNHIVNQCLHHHNIYHLGRDMYFHKYIRQVVVLRLVAY